MGRARVEHDQHGPFVAVGLECADETRAALSLAGVRFDEGDPDDCGCGGPTLALFRLHFPFDQDRVNACLAGRDPSIPRPAVEP